MSERLFFFIEIIAVFGLVIGFACWELYSTRRGMKKKSPETAAASDPEASSSPGPNLANPNAKDPGPKDPG